MSTYTHHAFSFRLPACHVPRTDCVDSTISGRALTMSEARQIAGGLWYAPRASSAAGQSSAATHKAVSGLRYHGLSIRESVRIAIAHAEARLKRDDALKPAAIAIATPSETPTAIQQMPVVECYRYKGWAVLYFRASYRGYYALGVSKDHVLAELRRQGARWEAAS